jgi:Fe-S cluster biogenesis protein NfuA
MNDNPDLLAKLHKLIQQLESSADPSTQARMREIVQTLMDFHAQAITQLLEQIADSETAGCALIDKLAENELISSMLLLYNLHPLDMDARIGLALEKVRPYLHSHGGNVELLSTADGIVRLRLQGSCHGCPSSTATLKQTIETAIYEKAPDVLGIEVEGEITNVPANELVNTGRLALPILSG